MTDWLTGWLQPAQIKQATINWIASKLTTQIGFDLI